MRSSSRQDLVSVFVALLSGWLLASLRPGLASDFIRVKSNSDAYLLPSVQQTYVASLGYRSALADLILGHVLVSYGLHFDAKRRFEHVGDYLDVINELDPKFRTPYALADTLLTLQPKAPPIESYRKARAIQERGLRELPTDQALWSTAGQFLAYLAPEQLKDEAEKREYKQAGARYLMRACELVGSNEQLPYICVTAAYLLKADGKGVAARQFLERFLAATDDSHLQDLAGGYLLRIAGEQAQADAKARLRRFSDAWHADLPFAPRVEVTSLAPRFDPADCAGLERARTAECASSWAAWAGETAAASSP